MILSCLCPGSQHPSTLWKLWGGRSCSGQHLLLHVAPTRTISSLAGRGEEGKLLAWAWSSQSHVAGEGVTSQGTPGVRDLIQPFPFPYFCLQLG